MTDNSTTAPNTILRLDLPPLPRPAIGASLNAIFVLIGDAHKLAYVDPYTNLRRQLPAVPNDDLKGRDPSW